MSWKDTLLEIATFGQYESAQERAAKRAQKQATATSTGPSNIAGTGVSMDQAQSSAAKAALDAVDQQGANLEAMRAAVGKARTGMQNAYDVGASDYTRQAASSLAAAQASAGGLGGSVMGAGRDIGGMAGRDLAQYRAQQGDAMGRFDVQAQEAFNQGELDKLQQIIQANEYLYGIGDPATQARQRFVSQYQPALEKALRDNSGLFDDGSAFMAIKMAMAQMETDAQVRALIMSYGV
jgi:hypothetical protein